MTLSRMLARSGPWLITLGPAWFVGDTLTNQLNVPLLAAALIAAGVELTGISTFHTFTRLYSWNRSLTRKTDPRGPTWISIALIAGYAASGLVLTAVIKNQWELGLFFLLAIVGYANIALNIDQDERERSLNAANAAKSTAPKPGRPQPATRPPAERPPSVPDRSPEYEADLLAVRRQAAGQPFKRADIETWTGRAKTSAVGLVNYGLERGHIKNAGRYTYVMNGTGLD